MTDKTDLRVIKTHKIIRQTFIELLGEYEFEQISVQQILDKALINRNTFYKYYSGKSALAGAMIADFKQEYQSLINQLLNGNDMLLFSGQVLPFIQANGELLLALWKIKTKRHHLYDDMFLMIKQAFIKLAIQKMDENAKNDWDYESEIFAHLALSSLKYQLENGQVLPLNKILPKWEKMLAVVRD